MATAQTGTRQDRATPIPQKDSGRPVGRLTKAQTQERLDALKITPQYEDVDKLTSMRFTDPNDPKHKGLTFRQLVAAHASAAQAEKEAKRVKDEASKDLCAALSAAGLEAVMCDGRKVTLVDGNSGARIDAKVLAELGVDLEIIAKATKLGNSYMYALNTPPKEK